MLKIEFICLKDDPERLQELKLRARRLIAEARKGNISPGSGSRSGSNSGTETPSDTSLSHTRSLDSPPKAVNSPDSTCDNRNKVCYSSKDSERNLIL